MKLISLSLVSHVLATYTHFSEENDKSLRPKGAMSKCLTLTSGTKIKFIDCENPVSEKQQWIVKQGNYFGRSYRSVYLFKNPQGGLAVNKEMCVTVANNNKAKKVKRCANFNIRGGYPKQVFDMLGDEDQLSFPRYDGSKRDCLGVNPTNGLLSLGECDATSCNTGRDVNFKCSSCGWRWSHENKCDYCENSSHVLTNDGDCIDINSVSKCTEKYPMSFTMKTLKWYHLQGQTYCTSCDPNNESKCLTDACPQQYNTGITRQGKCQCPNNSAAIYVQSGGPYVVYTGCTNTRAGNTWANHDYGRNVNCKNNSYQTAPESKCNKCMWYMQFFCSGCKTKNAVVFYGNPGNRMYCLCPDGFTYKSAGDKCVKI